MAEITLSDYLPFLFKPKAAKFVSERGNPVHGIVAEFETTADVTHAAEHIRDAGYKSWDVYAPFPIHGIDEAMGIKRTILPVIMALGAFTGIGGAFLMQYWISAVDYPVVVQGKPYGAWEPFVPIIFELGVLLSAFTALGSMLMLNGLPRWNHPLFSHERFLRVSDDRFMVCIQSDDPKFDPQIVTSMLRELGGSHVDLIEDEG